jgi:hypothetical protein
MAKIERCGMPTVAQCRPMMAPHLAPTTRSATVAPNVQTPTVAGVTVCQHVVDDGGDRWCPAGRHKMFGHRRSHGFSVTVIGTFFAVHEP